MDTARIWRWLAACLLAAGTIIGVATATPAQAQLLGGFGTFESPEVPAGTFQTFTGPTTMGPWDVTNGSVDLTGAGFWQVADGSQSLDLNGTDAGTITQQFVTGGGTGTEVTYELAGNPDGGPAIKTGQVLVNGIVVQNFSFDTTGKTRADMGYVPEKIILDDVFLGVPVTFRSTTPGAFGPVIDDVNADGCPGPLICH